MGSNSASSITLRCYRSCLALNCGWLGEERSRKHISSIGLQLVILWSIAGFAQNHPPLSIRPYYSCPGPLGSLPRRSYSIILGKIAPKQARLLYYGQNSPISAPTPESARKPTGRPRESTCIHARTDKYSCTIHPARHAAKPPHTLAAAFPSAFHTLFYLSNSLPTHSNLSQYPV